MIKESDWKKFKVIKEKALERFMGIALGNFEEAITDKDQSNHQKYVYLCELVENSDKSLATLFDWHSRFKAQMQLAFLRSDGLVTDEDLEGLSEELLEFTNPERFKNA